MDVLIIGAGLSGLTAACALAGHGLRVQVVAKGLGAMHWSAGTIDVLGYLPLSGEVSHPLDALSDLAQANPNHPYALVGRNGVEDALDEFESLMRKLGLPYERSRDRSNLRLPSPVGAARPAYLAPVAQMGGDLRHPQPLLIIGFQGLRDFYPSLIAENLRAQGHQARAISLPWHLLTERRDITTVNLARLVDDLQVQDRLLDAIKPYLGSGERLGLPAILGLEHHNQTWSRLQMELGTPVFEIPTLPPSVPGLRLANALGKHLHGLGARVEVGMEAIGFQVDANATTVTWIETATSARPLRHRARHIVLATGGFLGGGFASGPSGVVKEVVFGLPVNAPQDRTEWFSPRFLTGNGHALFRSGLVVDQHLQPRSQQGQPRYENLWSCGGALAGADAISERSLEGIAIATASHVAMHIHSSLHLAR